jgi:hypothetical protein
MACGFAPAATAWEKKGMDRKKFFDWLIALTVAAGLFAAPFTVPAVAAPHPAVVAGEMQAMADGMPCCPDQQDQKAKHCGSCPCIALCMFSITLPAPNGAAALGQRQPSRNLFALPDDLLADGLDAHPPDHPPRTIV